MKRESKKVKELCEFIWYLEDKYKLFDLKIKGIYIWEYIRMQVYYKLAQGTGVLSAPGKKVSLFDRIKVFLKGVKNTLTHNYYSLAKADVIFFSHPRSVKVDDAYIDVYTEYLIKEKAINNQVIDFEADYFGSHLRDRKHNVHKLNWIKQLVYIKYFFI